MTDDQHSELVRRLQKLEVNTKELWDAVYKGTQQNGSISSTLVKVHTLVKEIKTEQVKIDTRITTLENRWVQLFRTLSLGVIISILSGGGILFGIIQSSTDANSKPSEEQVKK